MQKNKRKIIFDSIIIGAALFSMFFGAGNMIFPPFLGFKSGTEWFGGFAGYYVADIGLAVIAILSQIKTKGHEKLLNPLGKWVGGAMMFAIVMCVGPFISIPRTAATTYELSVQPLLPQMNMAVFYLIFFVVVALMCFNKSAVVDIVGKILTPVLFIGLLVLIVVGIINPMGEINLPPRTESVVADGIEAGYQSMDVLAAVVFGVIILNSASSKGHSEPKQQAKVAAGAGIVAGIGLLVIYLGLTYLGATASSIYDTHVTRAELLTAIISDLLPGSVGSIFFAVVAGFACVSTAVALVCSAAEYLEGLTKGKVNYKIFVIAICVFGAVISMAGVEMLITFASPVLGVVYPPVLVLVLLSFLGEKVGNLSRKCAAFVATLFGVTDALAGFGITVPFIKYLPFAGVGLAWVVPTALVFAAGFGAEKLIKRRKSKKFIEN